MNILVPRLLLALAYPLLAHAASARGSGGLAILALADLTLVILLESLLRGRGAAWLAAALVAAGLWWLSTSAHALLPLLLVPVLVLAFIAWMFGRTLRAGRVPLISSIVSALEQTPAAQLAPEAH